MKSGYKDGNRRRTVLAGLFGLGVGVLAFTAGAPAAFAQDQVQIGLATKAWYPSVIAQAAAQQDFFAAEGIEAEITVYQSGAEAFTALAAGAADIISTSPNIVASGRSKGVDTKLFAMGASGNLGWQLIVPPDSDVQSADQLDGKNVGITSAGSLSDALAHWTMEKYGISFTTIPLGGGLAPNLISGNVDAIVLYSPLSFQVLQDGDGRSIIDYGSAMPEHLNSGWAASDTFIAEETELLQKTTNALFRGLAYLQDNGDAAVKLIAEINGIPESVARQEYENVYLKLSRTGEMTLDQAREAVELARLAGLKDLAPAEDIFTDAVTTAAADR